MKRVFIYLLLLTGAMVLNSCYFTPHIANCKASILSQYGGVVEAAVYIEGNDGNYITGAQVTVTNPAKAMVTMGFDMEKGCYYGVFDQMISGIYNIDIDSYLLQNTQMLTIDHYIPSDQPVVTECSDTSGNNALISQSLNGSEVITLRWNDVLPITAYSIRINDNAVLIYSKNTDKNSISIPADKLTAGTYTAKITAQWIHGDPYLSSSDTYSASQSPGYSFLFTVQ